jgi:hypothetical protein
MTIAYDYIGRRQAQAHAEEIELDRVRADIAGMEAQVEKLTSNLAAARQYRAEEAGLTLLRVEAQLRQGR